MVYRSAFVFWLINIIDDVTAAIFIAKTRALSWPQFWYNFLKINVKVPLKDTKIWLENFAFYVWLLKR